jgi:transposase
MLLNLLMKCFRIMKSEFKARPVYLSREERIKAHLILDLYH